MDTGDSILEGLEAAPERSIAEGIHVSDDNAIVLDCNVEKEMEHLALNGNSENVSVMNENGTNSSLKNTNGRSNVRGKSNGSISSKQVEVKGPIRVAKGKLKDSNEKSQNGKLSQLKNVPVTVRVSQERNGEDARAQSSISNGSVCVSAGSKQQSLKNKVLSEKHPLSSKYSVMPNEMVTDDSKEKKKEKPMKKKEPSLKLTDGKSALTVTSDNTRVHKVGVLPNYGFNFKCDERAEKRKEFNSKLEEKTHAKEEERSTLQAKSKETQEAEIKLLRKSLSFKAMPMPTFYQEPTPPKIELKKLPQIPPTRARSPKLGRRKSLSAFEPMEDNSGSTRPGRLSLGEGKAPPRATSLKVVSTSLMKKPPRGSLARPYVANLKSLPKETDAAAAAAAAVTDEEPYKEEVVPAQVL